MENSITQNPIRVNQVGFTKNGPKRFVLTDNQSGEDTFSVYHFYECDKAPREVYTGKMTLADAEKGLITLVITKLPALYALAISGASTRRRNTFSENCSFDTILYIRININISLL